MADKKQKPAFTHMRWSEADDKLLRELIERGADGTTISKTLGRTRSSIFNRKFVFSITRTAGKMYAQKLERQGIAAKTFFANFYRQKLLPKTFLKQRRHRRSTKHAP